MTNFFPPSRDRRWLAALIFAALFVRAAYCWKCPEWGPGGAIPDLDGYETIAENVYNHGTVAGPSGSPTAAREPGYPVLLAGLYLFTGPSYRAGQALNCVLDARSSGAGRRGSRPSSPRSILNFYTTPRRSGAKHSKRFFWRWRFGS